MTCPLVRVKPYDVSSDPDLYDESFDPDLYDMPSDPDRSAALYFWAE